MPKLSDLLTSAAAVRNESAAEKNTALRVGNVLYFLTQYLQQYTSVADISMKVSAVGVTITAKSQTSDTTLFDKTIALPVASSEQAGILTAEAFAAFMSDISELQEDLTALFNEKDVLADRVRVNSENIADLGFALRGKSANSSAYYDPFIAMGDIKGWPAFTDKLDGISDISELENKQKYMGRCRARVDGITVEVYHFINSFSNNDFSQVVLGNVSAIKDEQGKWQVTFTPNKFNIIHRQHKGGEWTDWQRINDNPLATSSLDGLMSAADKDKLDGYPSKFVLDLGIVDSQAEGEQEAAKSEVAGNRNISFIRFQVQEDEKNIKTTLIMQWPDGIDTTGQLMFTDQSQFRRSVTGATGVSGNTTNAYPWERTAPHFIDYDKSRRMLQLKDYLKRAVSNEDGVELPLATSTQDGLMSAEDKNALYTANEKAETAMRIINFDGIVNNVKIEEQGVPSYDSVYYDRGRGFFVAAKGMKYYISFLGSEEYNKGTDSGMKARADRLFQSTDDGFFYHYDGTELTQFILSYEDRVKLFAYPANPLDIPKATTTQPGLMSAEDKTKLNKTKHVVEVTWTEQHSMNAYTECGEYHIHGERKNKYDGLPIINADPGHTIDATLTVLDSSLPTEGAKNDVCVTQILRMSNRTGGDGHIFIRTGQASKKSQLASGSSTSWGTWEKLMGIFEKNGITSVNELNACTTNGMYSGLYANPNQASLGGVNFYPGDTFLIITANGYAASPFGTPQLTQILFKFPVRKAPLPATANLYIRVAYWDTSDANNKRWVFGNFAKMVTAAEFASLETRIATLEAKLK